MLFRTHILIGFLLGLLALDILDVENKFIFLIFTIIFSSFPDVDHEGSKINNKLFFTKIFSFLFKHRGFVHSIFFALILFLIARKFGYYSAGYGVLVGYLAHLSADSLTRNGVRIFYPLFNFKIRGFIKTGGLIERMLFYCILALILLKISNLY